MLEFTFFADTVSVLELSLGYVNVSPPEIQVLAQEVDLLREYLLGSSVITGSTVKGLSQYWENMVTRVSSTIEALVRSVAVTSKKRFLVLQCPRCKKLQ